MSGGPRWTGGGDQPILGFRGWNCKESGESLEVCRSTARKDLRETEQLPRCENKKKREDAQASSRKVSKMEDRGLEPLTSTLPVLRSPS